MVDIIEYIEDDGFVVGVNIKVYLGIFICGKLKVLLVLFVGGFIDILVFGFIILGVNRKRKY